MTLARAWCATIQGSGPPGVDTLFATGPGHTDGPVYLPMNRDAAYGGILTNYPAANPWRLYIDINHRKSLLWQMAIVTSGVPAGLPMPARTFEGRTIYGLNLLGGEMRIRMTTDRKFYLAKQMQMLLHAQWVDTVGGYGSEITYNAVFVPKGRPTLDQALGAPPMARRDASGFNILPGRPMIDYALKFDPNELQDLGARPDRLFPSGLYGLIGSDLGSKRNVFNYRLANTLIVFHCPDAGDLIPGPEVNNVSGQYGHIVPPQYQPPDCWDNPGTPGLWYIASLEIWADPALNPNMAPV